MPRSKEISEEVRRKVVEAHESGKGYKQISKVIGLPKTTIRAILRKWKRFGTVVNLPRSGRPSKISLRARREIIREVMKNPCTTSKDLQATLALSNISVHQSTIRRILGIHRRPTLSSFEGSMALETSNPEEDKAIDVKNEEVLKNPNTNAKVRDDTEGAGRDENGSDGGKRSTRANGEDQTPSAGVHGGEDVQTTTSTVHDVPDGETSSTNPGSAGRADESEKSDVQTHDVTSAHSNNNNNNNNNNNTDGNWNEEMDYIRTLMFS